MSVTRPTKIRSRMGCTPSLPLPTSPSFNLSCVERRNAVQCDAGRKISDVIGCNISGRHFSQ